MPAFASVFILAQDEEEAGMFKTQLSTIHALTKGCKCVELARALPDIPPGCGSAVLTPTVAIHILVRVSSNSFRTCIFSTLLKSL